MAQKNNTFGRKILSVLLAVMMVVGMVGTAFAQGTAADPYDIGDIAYTSSRNSKPSGVIPEGTEWAYQSMTEVVYDCDTEEHEHSRRCNYGWGCDLEEHEHSERRCGVTEASRAIWKLVEKKQQVGGWPGWGGGYVLDESYYKGSRKFGWDTYSQNATMMDEDGNDIYTQITVQVGDTVLSKGSLSNGVTNADVVANGVTISGIPAGFYISAYKIVCEKYACYTDQAGNATDETVSLDAGKGSYSVSVSKADMGHANTGADKYWILIELSAYEQEQETIVTYPYSVLYNYGELAEELAQHTATVDSNTYAMNATASVLSPAVLEAAAALGYSFIGWEVESVIGSFAVTNGVVGTLVDPADSLTITGETTLKALWEKVVVPTYDIGYVVQGAAPETYSAIPAPEMDVEVGAAKTVAAGLTTSETTKNGIVGTWTFEGWATDDAQVADGAFAMPANDVEFVGTWSFKAAPTYSVTYAVEGAAPASYSEVPAAETGILEGAAKTVAAGLTTTETTRNGVVGTWTFNGWATEDASVSGAAYTMPGKNVEFVGTWSFEAAPTYSVTYVVKGAAPASYSEVPAAETGILEGTAMAVKAGLTTEETVKGTVVGTWSFNGWTTADAAVENGTYAMPGKNVEFVGTWTFVPAPTYGYTVVAEYYTNNAPDAAKTLAAVEGVLALPTAAEVEAAYSAANTVNNDLTYGYTSISVANGVYTLRYDRTVYQISYRVAGAAPASYSEVPAVESGVEAGAVKAVKEGLTTVETVHDGRVGTWTFNGWTTEDAEVVNGSFEMPAANVEFVGTWSFEAAPTYTITYTVQGEAPATFSEFSPLESGVLEGTEKAVASDMTTEETLRNGRQGTWVFNGWTTEDVEVVNGMFVMPGHDVVFVGTWTFQTNVVHIPGNDPQPEPTPDPVGGEEELEELEDEDVPLADVPQTGGIVGLFLTMTVASGAGLIALNRKKKEEE